MWECHFNARDENTIREKIYVSKYKYVKAVFQIKWLYNFGKERILFV